jgi:hypothetical protein
MPTPQSFDFASLEPCPFLRRHREWPNDSCATYKRDDQLAAAYRGVSSL